MRKMYHVISEGDCWTNDSGYAIVEFWTFLADNVIYITQEKLSARDFMDLPYLYDEVVIKEKERYSDD